MAVHVRYNSLYISLPVLRKKKREITKFCTNAAEQGLTLLSGRDVMLSLWYSDSQLKLGSSVTSDHFDATDLRL